MPVTIRFKTLTNDHFAFNAAVFLPEPDQRKPYHALFTHGYTASKSDNLPWAQRLSEAGVPCAIFDLPGHLLGGLNREASFMDFRLHAQECFVSAAEFLSEELVETPDRYILAGHSLGAMLSLKALELPKFSGSDTLAIGVGVGISQHKTTHLFESSFYQKTLNIRRQLVSPELDSDNVFPWIDKEKKSFSISGRRIHLITGADDVVVGAGGMQTFKERLEVLGNNVTSQEPKKLPHHEPGSASTYIYHFLKKELGL